MTETTTQPTSSNTKGTDDIVEIAGDDIVVIGESKTSFEDLLSDSTIQFLYATKLKEDGRDIHWGDKLVAILVLITQYALYGYLFEDAMSELHESTTTILVEDTHCDSITVSDLQCEDGVKDSPFGILFSGVFLFLAFISSDIAGTLRLFRIGSCAAKVTAVILFVEACIAAMCITMTAVTAMEQSGAGSILAAVGVVFVHELDKKVRAVYQYVPKFKQVILLCVVIVVVAMIGFFGAAFLNSWSR